MTVSSIHSTALRSTGRRALLEDVLVTAGIQIEGPNAWDIRVHDERFFDAVIARGTLGLGESYMAAWWDCAALDQLAERALRFQIADKRGIGFQLARLRLRLFDRRPREGAETVLGNEFYSRMLGPSMTYSAGQWRRATSLDEAQDHKHDAILEKLELEPDHRLLDVGCGWGSFLGHALARTGCRGHGITTSEAQWRYATQRHRDVPIELADVRAYAAEPFDRIVAIAVLEQLRDHRAVFDRVASLLTAGGIFVLDTVGHERGGSEPWLDRYVFPGSAAPSFGTIAAAIEKQFALVEWRCGGDDYDRTLLQWVKNFEAYARTAEFPFDRFRFYRMFRFYLYTLAGAFRARNLQHWQLVLRKR